MIHHFVSSAEQHVECRAWLGREENWGARKKPQSSHPFFARTFYFSHAQPAAIFCLLKWNYTQVRASTCEALIVAWWEDFWPWNSCCFFVCFVLCFVFDEIEAVTVWNVFWAHVNDGSIFTQGKKNCSSVILWKLATSLRQVWVALPNFTHEASCWSFEVPNHVKMSYLCFQCQSPSIAFNKSSLKNKHFFHQSLFYEHFKDFKINHRIK